MLHLLIILQIHSLMLHVTFFFFFCYFLFFNQFLVSLCHQEVVYFLSKASYIYIYTVQSLIYITMRPIKGLI